MISEKNLQMREVNQSELKKISKTCRIPVDSAENRNNFKKVPGMEKFLQKQYNAMIKREEAKVVEYNIGKIKE